MTSSPIKHQHSSLPPLHFFSISASNTDRERSEQQEETPDELESLDQLLEDYRGAIFLTPISFFPFSILSPLFDDFPIGARIVKPSQGFYHKFKEGTNMSVDSVGSMQTSNGGGSFATSIDNSSVGSNDSHARILSHQGLRRRANNNYSLAISCSGD